MRLLRRFVAVLFIVLGLAGLTACIIGVVYCLRIRETAIDRAGQSSERVVKLLGVARKNLVVVKSSLTNAQAKLHAVRRTAGPTAAKGIPFRGVMAKQLAGDVGVNLGDARQTLGTVTDMAVVVNSLLEGIRELPLTQTDTLDMDRIERVSGGVNALIGKGQELDGLLGQDSTGADESKIDENTQIMAEVLADSINAIAEVFERVTKIEKRLVEIRPNLNRWITLAVIGVTVVLFWVALGQVSLLVHGFSLWRGSARSSTR